MFLMAGAESSRCCMHFFFEGTTKEITIAKVEQIRNLLNTHFGGNK